MPEFITCEELEKATFKVDDLVGRTLKVMAFENEEGRAVVAKDIKTDEGFLFHLETK